MLGIMCLSYNVRSKDVREEYGDPAYYFDS